MISLSKSQHSKLLISTKLSESSSVWRRLWPPWFLKFFIRIWFLVAGTKIYRDLFLWARKGDGDGVTWKFWGFSSKPSWWLNYMHIKRLNKLFLGTFVKLGAKNHLPLSKLRTNLLLSCTIILWISFVICL